MPYHLMPSKGDPVSLAPSLLPAGVNTAEPDNPTVLPLSILKKFHWTFLIRHPRYSIPSNYRCCIPPLVHLTNWYDYQPYEAGYRELRTQLISSAVVQLTSIEIKPGVCLIDADDLLDNPSGVIKAYCKHVGVEYNPNMLSWDTEDDKALASEMFSKWHGFHEDALHSKGLVARAHPPKTKAEQDQEWVRLYGVTGAAVIRETVNASLPHYEHLKQFAMKF
ncbi:MAG: hypothetical protein Q9200_006977 [Gallowayella weberi]